jgi:hypothetical protein
MILPQISSTSLRDRKLISTINEVNKIESLLSTLEKKKIDKKVIIERFKKTSNPSKKATYTTFVNFMLSDF